VHTLAISEQNIGRHMPGYEAIQAMNHVDQADGSYSRAAGRSSLALWIIGGPTLAILEQNIGRPRPAYFKPHRP
jgi:hypothetical protein